jgi:hypothetical protein
MFANFTFKKYGVLFFIILLSVFGVWSWNMTISRNQVFNKIPEVPKLSPSSELIPGKILSVSDSDAFSIAKEDNDYLLNIDSYNFDKDKISQLKNYLIDASVKKWATSNNEIEYRKSEESRMNLDLVNPSGRSIDFYLMNHFAETSFAAEDKVFYSPVKILRKDKNLYTLEISPPKSNYNYVFNDSRINKGYREPIKITKENIGFTDLSCVATRLNGLNIILLAPRGYDKKQAGSNTLDSNTMSCNLSNLDPSKKYYVDYYQRFMSNFRGSDDAIEFNKDHWIDIIEGF